MLRLKVGHFKSSLHQVRHSCNYTLVLIDFVLLGKECPTFLSSPPTLPTIRAGRNMPRRRSAQASTRLRSILESLVFLHNASGKTKILILGDRVQAGASYTLPVAAVLFLTRLLLTRRLSINFAGTLSRQIARSELLNQPNQFFPAPTSTANRNLFSFYPPTSDKMPRDDKQAVLRWSFSWSRST